MGSPLHRIVVVGGGAGGVELATRLGDKLGRPGLAHVTLVDRSRTHLWKPLLHEVAAGSMGMHQHQLDYLAQALWHHFTFVLGPLAGLDRAAKQIVVGAVRDDEDSIILPERRVPYDRLVVAIGSESNDVGTPGVREHAFTLDTAWQAHLFHRRLVNACFQANFLPAVPEAALENGFQRSVLAFLAKAEAISQGLREKLLGWPTAAFRCTTRCGWTMPKAAASSPATCCGPPSPSRR